jgi:hypothetical protein
MRLLIRSRARSGRQPQPIRPSGAAPPRLCRIGMPVPSAPRRTARCSGSRRRRGSIRPGPGPADHRQGLLRRHRRRIGQCRLQRRRSGSRRVGAARLVRDRNGVCVGSASLPPARSSTYQRCANRGRTGCLRSHPHTGSRRGWYAEHGASRRQCVGRGFEPVLGSRRSRHLRRSAAGWRLCLSPLATADQRPLGHARSASR